MEKSETENWMSKQAKKETKFVQRKGVKLEKWYEKSETKKLIKKEMK